MKRLFQLACSNSFPLLSPSINTDQPKTERSFHSCSTKENDHVSSNCLKRLLILYVTVLPVELNGQLLLGNIDYRLFFQKTQTSGAIFRRRFSYN